MSPSFTFSSSHILTCYYLYPYHIGYELITDLLGTRCMRRLQANFAFLTNLVSREQKPQDKIIERPPIMEAIGTIEGNTMSEDALGKLRDMYKNLKELFPPAPPPRPNTTTSGNTASHLVGSSVPVPIDAGGGGSANSSGGQTTVGGQVTAGGPVRNPLTTGASGMGLPGGLTPAQMQGLRAAQAQQQLQMLKEQHAQQTKAAAAAAQQAALQQQQGQGGAGGGGGPG